MYRNIYRFGRNCFEHIARLAGVFATAVFALTLSATAEGNVFFAGGSIDHADSAFVGARIALPGAQDGNGFAIAASAYGGTYAYDGDSSQRIDAEFTGGQVSLQYIYTSDQYWGSIGVGYRSTNTYFEPDDLGNENRGVVGEALIEASGGRVWNEMRVDYYGSYALDTSDYLARASLTRQTNLWNGRIGARASFQGGNEYEIQQVGPEIVFVASENTEIILGAGASFPSFEDTSAYASLELIRTF